MKLLNKNKSLLIIIIGSLTISISGCKKLVEVDPPITSINGENVFDEDASAIAVLTGIYTNMSNTSIASTNGWLTNICFTTGLAGDELKLWNLSNEAFSPYYYNNISTLDITWANIYKMIFITNSAIEGLPNGKLLTPSVKNQLLGEAKFMRALCYFYLVNLYGGVPLAISTNYKINRLLARESTTVIYNQIISDLKDAQMLMSSSYLGKDLITTTNERVRPSKWAATALLARVYLYLGNYTAAEVEATSVINNIALYELVDEDHCFLMNSREAIWQLQPVGVESESSANTREGQIFNLMAMPSSDAFIVYLNENLVNGFDPKDQRKSKWINSISVNGTTYYFPYKYKVGLEHEMTKEYSTVIRLAELYLIRAEARIIQGQIADGISDINKLRTRATDLTVPFDDQLKPIPLTLSREDALVALEEERKFELFAEWGHRWLDLKRYKRIDLVLEDIKPGWETTDQLFPIPQIEVESNPNIRGHQNPGY